MNGKLLISLFAGLLLAGGAFTAALAQEECQEMEIPENEECKGDRNNPIVKINLEGEDIIVDPPVVCAALGTTVKFKLRALVMHDMSFVSIMPKPESTAAPERKVNTWLLGTNSLDVRKIEVRVPRWVEKKEDYEYGIWLKDGTCIDPRVHVE